MKTIWKFVLNPNKVFIEMPANAEILIAKEQKDDICVWALVDLDSTAEKETRCFEVFGTGHVIKEDIGIKRKYIGTASMQESCLILHVFERVT